jgi:CRP-like cAMP-binding protein
MSPRASATAHELSRVALLAELPGQTLAELAKRMEREEIEPGTALVEEGSHGERFYVVLSGMMTVSQSDLGPRSILRPGEYFGEVALTMKIPRTASVRALTPAVVASCDRETFDQVIRPRFADDE